MVVDRHTDWKFVTAGFKIRKNSFSVHVSYCQALTITNSASAQHSSVFDLPGSWQGLAPPLHEDDALPSGGRKFRVPQRRVSSNRGGRKRRFSVLSGNSVAVFSGSFGDDKAKIIDNLCRSLAGPECRFYVNLCFRAAQGLGFLKI